MELGVDPLCLVARYPQAYLELPECYKADHALRFFLDANNNLCAEHKLCHEEYLFSPGEGWVRGK